MIQSDGLAFPKNPLPINYRTIFEALKDVYPDQAFIIYTAIRKIIVIKQETPGFSTMGITADGKLLIHQTFWDQHMHDPYSLSTVLMHELMHFVLGDVFNLKSSQDGPDWQLQNLADLIAMDARINAYIVLSRPDLLPEKFFTSFYNEEVCNNDFTHKLLRPESIFNSDPDQQTLAPYYEKLYSADDCTNHEELSKVVYEILKKRNKNKKQTTLKIKLIGSHGENGQDIDDLDLENIENIQIEISKDDIEEAKEEYEKESGLQAKEAKPEKAQSEIKKAIIEHLKENSFRSKAAGKGANLNSIILNKALNITEKLDVSKFKMLAFNSIFHNFRSQAKVKTGTWSTSPIIPNSIAITDSIKLAMDYPVMLFKRKKYESKIDKNLLPIYLDVSGSTHSYLPEIIQLIVNVSSKIDYVWGFSDFVAKHSMDDLKDLRLQSSGGTCFDCIVEHATENNFKNIVVITDGEARCRSSEMIPGIQSIVTILFGYACKDNFFTRIYGNTHMIDEVKL